MKLCEKCQAQFKKAARRGGRNGSHADKIRASLAAAEARAKSALRLTLNGETRTVAEWSEARSIPKATIWARMRAGKPAHQILSTHIRNTKNTTKKA